MSKSDSDLQVVASQDITEKYLFDFRLVWRCFLEQLAEVMGTTATICRKKPHLLVDGMRAARLLDAMIEVAFASSSSFASLWR